MKKIVTLILSLSIRLLYAQCPDLVISNGAILNLEPNSIRYAINLSNIGNKDTPLDWSAATEQDNVVIKSYLSFDTIIDTGDLRIQEIVLGHTPLTAIKAGEIFSIVNRDSIRTAGYQYLLLRIDTHNNINECSIQNNTFLIPMRRNQLTLETSNVEGAKGTTVEIPVFASDFFNVLGFQFSLSFSKPGLIRIDSIGNIGLAELNRSDIRQKEGSTIGAIWFSSFQNGLSFDGRKKIFSIYATLVGEPGACSDISFDGSFLPIEFISSSTLSEPIKPLILNGRVCIQNLVECSGKVTLSNNVPIINAIVKANQSSVLTDFNGKYVIKDLTPGVNYTLSASKKDAYANGLSVIDIILIKKHLLQIQPLPTPYEIIAADVNGDLTVSIQDILIIRDLILGIIPDFGKTPVWQFIPKDYKFKNPLNPFLEVYPISYSLPVLNSNKSSLDFIGIKTGDVSLDWSERLNPSLESRSADYFTLSLQNEKLDANREYTLPIYSRQFNNINGFQFALSLNPSVQFEKISCPSIPDFNENNYASNGSNLNVLWYDTRPQTGRFVKDTGVLFYISFKTIKPIESKSLFVLNTTNINPEGSHEQGWRYSIKLETLNMHGISDPVNHAFELKIYPNPVSNELHISFHPMQEIGSASIKIMDIYGRIVSEHLVRSTLGANILTVPTMHWTEGKYFVTLTHHGNTQVSTFSCIH